MRGGGTSRAAGYARSGVAKTPATAGDDPGTAGPRYRPEHTCHRQARIRTDQYATAVHRQRLGAERLAAEPDATAEIIAHCARLPLALAVVTARPAARPRHRLGELARQLREAQARLDVLSDPDPAIDIRAALDVSYRATDTSAQRRAGRHRMFDHYLHTAEAASNLVGAPALPGPPPAPSQVGSTPEQLRDPAQARTWLIAERQVLIATVSEASRTGFSTHCWQLARAMIYFATYHGLLRDQITAAP